MSNFDFATHWGQNDMIYVSDVIDHRRDLVTEHGRWDSQRAIENPESEPTLDQEIIAKLDVLLDEVMDATSEIEDEYLIRKQYMPDYIQEYMCSVFDIPDQILPYVNWNGMIDDFVQNMHEIEIDNHVYFIRMS